MIYIPKANSVNLSRILNYMLEYEPIEGNENEKLREKVREMREDKFETDYENIKLIAKFPDFLSPDQELYQGISEKD